MISREELRSYRLNSMEEPTDEMLEGGFRDAVRQIEEYRNAIQQQKS